MLRMFVLLSTYCDDRGVCYPGVRELSERSGYSVEDVIAALECLEAAGLLVYLRRDEHERLTHRQLPNIYALNCLLYVARNPSVEGAFFADNGSDSDFSLEKPDRKIEGFLIHNQNQESETRISEPESSNHHHQPHKTPTNGVDRAGDAARALSWSSESKDKSKNKDGGNGYATKRQRQQNSASSNKNSEANSASPTTSPLPPPPSHAEPDDLEIYKSPLADPLHESVAQELISLAGNFSHPNARMLVATYGPGLCRTALRMFRQQPRGSVENPAGWVRSMLRKHRLSEEDTQPADENPVTYDEYERRQQNADMPY